ncbi:thioesterase II family protein [Microbulbifer sp. SA54]|uniref:thioesterase II family protein n=1 Tax=Microbulbifer sp. SA54 TaxID=3401577 RepID=UPI003AAB134C
MNDWLLIPKLKPESSHRLVCFPYAGGTAATYIRWADWLPDSVELIAVQPPGRSSHIHVPPCLTMNALVRGAHKALESYLSDKPYSIFGHSLGARVAFELVKRLERTGCALPSHLYVSASRAPHLTTLRNPSFTLPDEMFLDKMRRMGGMPDSILRDPEQLALYLPSLRADFRIVDTYRGKVSQVPVPIHCFYSRDDEHIDVEDALAWIDYSRCGFSSEEVGGGHFYVNDCAEFWRAFTNTLEQRIREAGSCPSSGRARNEVKSATGAVRP